MQKQCHALAHSSITEKSSRAISLIRNVKGCLMLSQHLLSLLPFQSEQHELKDFHATFSKLQSVLDKL